MGEKGFDASKYLTHWEGREYLEVKWRLLWLRTEHPDAALHTELIEHRDGYALFKATAALPGGGEATGWGSETADEFEDYLEAAETKSLGRALAALGYGTQFCQDFAFREDSTEPLADAPVTVRKPPAEDAPDAGYHLEPLERVLGRRTARQRAAKATEAQVKAIYAIARQVYNWQEDTLEGRCRELLGYPPGALTKREASRFIDDLKGKRLAV